MHPFDTLLEKAKIAHENWVKGAPMPKGFSADMEKLGEAVKDAEALKSTFRNLKVLECRAFKVKSYLGDKQAMVVCLTLDERGEPYFTIEIRTLTKKPEKYGYDDILRRINGYFYIRNSFGMRVCVWSAFFEAVAQMKGATTKALVEYLDKKEKSNGR